MSSQPELDPVIHAQSRLRVMVALQELPPDDQLTFQRLQSLLEMTAGNLSAQLRKLEESGYVNVRKTYEKRRPTTYLSLTWDGRQALREYITSIHKLLNGHSDPTTTT